MNYLVLQPIWHTGDGCYHAPGEIVSLDHLPPETVNRLIDAGVVESTTGERPAAVTPAPPEPPAQQYTDTAFGLVPVPAPKSRTGKAKPAQAKETKEQL